MIHIINENNELKHRKFPLGRGIKKYLLKIKSQYKGDKNVEGYKRLNNILEMDGINYNEMKRLKNFFDNYNGDTNSTEYILNGGKNMALWVNNTLNNATKSVYEFKKAQKEAGISNAFIKPHEKNRQTSVKKPTKVKIKNDSTNLLNGTSLKFESRNRIYIISEDILKDIDINEECYKTYDDILKEKNKFIHNDFTLRKAMFYKKHNIITIYSYKPIMDNDIVYTSKKEALSKSDNGAIFSKKVPLTDIQWLSPNIGKYIHVL